jgi:CubicO group peptidase (beta-lactamase class C family)
MTEKRNVASPPQSLLRQIAVWIPVVAWAAYRILDKGDFTPYPCALAGINCPNPTSTVSGFVAPEYSHIKNLMLENIIKGDDVGAGVAVYVDGQLKMDMYAGWMDRESNQVYTNETLQMVFSCSKVMVSAMVFFFFVGWKACTTSHSKERNMLCHRIWIDRYRCCWTCG